VDPVLCPVRVVDCAVLKVVEEADVEGILEVVANTSVEVLSSGMCYFERVLWMKGGGKSGHEGDSIECSIFSTLQNLIDRIRIEETRWRRDRNWEDDEDVPFSVMAVGSMIDDEEQQSLNWEIFYFWGDSFVIGPLTIT
jgi:hypothetical protein